MFVISVLKSSKNAGPLALMHRRVPDQVPELRQLIGHITTTLVATDTAPEHDADGAPAAATTPSSSRSNRSRDNEESLPCHVPAHHTTAWWRARVRAT